MIELDAAPEPTDAEHRKVSELVALHVQQKRNVERLTEELKLANAALNRTETQDLPTALESVGYLAPTKTTIAGREVSFRELYRGTQLDNRPDGGNKRPLEERLRGLKWLDDNGHGDLPKRTLTVTLGADTAELADELETILRSHRAANSFQVEQTRLVHAATMGAFVKELHRQREDPPLADLGVAVMKVAEVK